MPQYFPEPTCTGSGRGRSERLEFEKIKNVFQPEVSEMQSPKGWHAFRPFSGLENSQLTVLKRRKYLSPLQLNIPSFSLLTKVTNMKNNLIGIYYLRLLERIAGLALMLALACAANASTTTIDFNGVDTSSGFATGPAVSNYLATFGVSTPNNPSVIDTTFYAPFIASPTKNIITGGDGRDPTVLTFLFDKPVADLSFVRAGVVGALSPSGTIAGEWTATAYDASDKIIATVGEALVSFYGDRPPLSFRLAGSNIKRVTFAGYDHGYAGINVPQITLIEFQSAGSSPCSSTTLATPSVGTVAGTNWTMDYAVTASDGLRLDNVRLGSRLMATSMTLPYFNLLDIHGRTLQRCELKPEGDSAAACHSRLVAFDSSPAGTTEVIMATYEVDNLPNAPDTCLRITQQYEFDTELDPKVNPQVACEPTVGLPCAKFRPLVTYEFTQPAGAASPIFSGGINVVQRLQFNVTPAGVTTPMAANSALVATECANLKCLLSVKTVVSLDGNPLPAEVRFKAISNGRGGAEDNYHQTYKAVIEEPQFSVVAKGKSCPDLIKFGCPECVHIHWIWNRFASWLSQKCYGGPDLNNGQPIIPQNSNQDVEIGISLFHSGEEHPFDFRTLIDSRVPEALSGGVPVFWNSSTSYMRSDQFFIYGGFFSSSPPI